METKNLNKRFQFLDLPDPIFFQILTFLEFQDLLSFQTSSKTIFTIFTEKKILKNFVLFGGITKNSRKMFYNYILKIRKTKLMTFNELTDYHVQKEKNLYHQITELSKEAQANNKDPKFIHVCQEIEMDLDRTFYTEKFISGMGKKYLKNILVNLGFVRPEIGYTQGMNFIAGALIHFFINDNEKENDEFSFWVFLSMIDNLNLSLLYLQNMPDFSIRIFQLKYYIHKYLPNLSNHFKNYEINIDVLFSKWILTLFSSYLPFPTLEKVWDVFLIDKWKSIFRFCLSFLSDIYDIIINMDLNAMTKYLREHIYNLHANYNKIKTLYKKFKITNKELEELRDDYFMEKVQAKLEVIYF